VLALVGVVTAMAHLGHGPLAAPDLGAPASWSGWVAARTAPQAAVALLRLVVLGLASYLLAVTALALVVRLGDARYVTLADVVTLPCVRGVVHASIGMGVVVAAVGASGSLAVHRAPSGVPTAAEVALVSSVAPPAPPTGSPPPVLQKVTAPAPAAERTWTVGSGEHFWSISTRVLAAAWGRAPSDVEVVPYWEQLIEANRDRLADRSNPDLLFPGQQLVVPPPPPTR
jgi:hypothetical protein